MKDLLRTDMLTTFIHVARSQSFSAVARLQGMAASSITRQIDNLEQVLETKLFFRSTRGLSLTDAGEILFARAQGIINDLVDVQAELAALNGEPQGVLRIACLPTFGRQHIIPMLAELFTRYPKIRVELDQTERLTDPVRDRLDVVIRIGELKDSTLYSKRIATQTWIICASPDYIQKHGIPTTLTELGGHYLLDKHHDPAGICWSRYRSIINFSDNNRIFRSDDFETLRMAAVSGFGIALLPNWVVSSDIHSGKLVPLFNDPDGRKEDIYLLRALAHPPAKLTVFMSLLQKRFAKII
ncbi:LysR family transcriptional regulator [Photorhabdus noenieputensis]|uniref:LysR family transcriptional regulator n=1 Tax=Photorhabdus noenieputensis TaxID=1208607 RepID=UPI001BD25031|nr:LysR family transcriptional regulator [Photorhabdus noenieputensis]MBS9437293.1 LysR family transcriptional regulator [Photorhabdus noenieputensis]MCK3668607.1 LysR family transcriptional regulator [Photorhabdus noenieputensis]